MPSGQHRTCEVFRNSSKEPPDPRVVSENKDEFQDNTKKMSLAMLPP